MTKRFLCIASILFALVMLGSCDDNKSDGGGGGQPQAETTGTDGVAIRGLATVSSRGTTTYRAVSYPNATGAIKWQWEIQGHAVIAGSAEGRLVKVNITGPAGGGEFTLSLIAKIAKGPWLKVKDFKVTVSPYPLFRLVVHNAVTGSLTPTSQTGTGDMTAASEYTTYQKWSLYFVGNTTTFPALVNVRVYQAGGCSFCNTYWTTGSPSMIYLDFPKQGGGTVGSGGTVYDPGVDRPYLRNPGGPNYNYLSLFADGVQNMDLRVKR